MSALHYDAAQLRRILLENRRIAIVGLSRNPMRPSHFAARYLLEKGYTVLPVNPSYEEVLGLPCYPDLRAVPGPVHVVDLFQTSDKVAPFVEDAIAIGARVVWMQLGIVNQAAAERAQRAGLEVIMDRCMKIEYARLFGGLHWCGVNTRVISARRPRTPVHTEPASGT